jgi:hypothetical protein
MKRANVVKILIDGDLIFLKGDSFQEMLDRVRSLPGRRWNKVRGFWEVDGTFEEVREVLQDFLDD